MNKSLSSIGNLNPIILGAITIGFLRFFFAIFFGRDASTWYVVVSYILELLPFLVAACFCFRNYFNLKILSDRKIWFCLGSGTLSFFIGDAIFLYWEVILQRSPDITLGDIFFVIFYLFLIAGMSFAVVFRKVRLMLWQWAIIILVAVLSSWLGWWTSYPSQDLASELTQTNVVEAVDTVAAPGWVLAVEQTLEPMVEALNLFYVIGDVLILVLAAAIVLTFWGGRFSQTWMAIGCGISSHYLADLRYAYIVTRSDYATGGVVECFWTVSALLITVGAVLEYDLSNRSRHRSL